MMKIKFKILLLFVFILQNVVLKSQTPDWQVNPNLFNYNMTITGAINLDFTESIDTNDLIGAFVDDECRGFVNLIYQEQIDRYICYLMIYSNLTNETINFKVYDASSQTIIDIPKTIDFEVNGIIGSMEKPYIFSNPTLSNESFILSYSIDGQTKEARFEENNIYVEIAWGSVFTNLVATFTTSEYAQVKISDVVQQSGITENDFTSPVVYSVRSADETDTSYYNVYVSWENMSPTWITLSDTVINETYKKGSFIGYLTTTDADITDLHQYTLVEGEGDIDNYRFLIDGNKLYLNEDVYFQTVTSFSLRVKTDDGKGGTFERIIVISIEFITGQTQVRSNNIVSPNGDGKFDTWKIYNAGLYYDSEIVIVNSIGEIIFQTIGYETEWDGTYNGIELPIGAYFYIIKTSQNQILRGSITLIK